MARTRRRQQRRKSVNERLIDRKQMKCNKECTKFLLQALFRLLPLFTCAPTSLELDTHWRWEEPEREGNFFARGRKEGVSESGATSSSSEGSRVEK